MFRSKHPFVSECIFTRLMKGFEFQVDVANYEEIVALKEQIKIDLGEVDILVNNAGVLPRVSLLQGNPEDLVRIIKVNLVGSFWVSFDQFIKLSAMCKLVFL